MTAENAPVDTIAAIALVPRTTDAETIGPQAGKRNHGAGLQIARRDREEIALQNERNVLVGTGQRKEENDLGETGRRSDLARRALEDIAVTERDMIAAAEQPAYTISMLAHLPATNETPYTQGSVLLQELVQSSPSNVSSSARVNQYSAEFPTFRGLGSWPRHLPEEVKSVAIVI
jgi:hypothetical protein